MFPLFTPIKPMTKLKAVVEFNKPITCGNTFVHAPQSILILTPIKTATATGITADSTLINWSFFLVASIR
jgi:hypothetical protein